MLSKRVDELPAGAGWIFEPKWDGFRALIFRDKDEILIQSRDEKPLNRYFPELIEPLQTKLPDRCVLDGEIVIAKNGALDFEALQLRLHPAASRAKLLSQQIPASIVFFDLLCEGDRDLQGEPFIKAQALHVGVEILPFIMSRKLIVTNLTIDQPYIELVQGPSGNWNFSSLGGKSTTPSSRTPSSARVPLDLSVQLIRVTNGRLTLRRATGHWKPLVLEQGNIELRDFSATSVFPFSVSARVRGGGAVTLNGKAGPINPADSAMTPVAANFSVTQLDLAGSGANDMAPSVAGLVSFSGVGDSDGINMHVKAKLKAENLRLVRKGTPATRPVELDFSVQHNLRKHSGVLHQGDIHIGSATAGSVATGAKGSGRVIQ